MRALIGREECLHATIMQTWLWLFCSSREQEFEKVFEFKTRQVDFIYPFLRRLKLAKPFKTSCANFFKLICQATKIRILESIFLQNKIDFVYETLRVVRVHLLWALPQQRVLRFVSEMLFYKSNKKLFSCVCIA